MTRRDFLTASAGSLAAVFMLGCEQDPPLAFVYIEDPTSSCFKGRDKFRQDMAHILAGGYLGKGTSIALIHACHDPHLLWAGPARKGKEVKSAFERAGKPCPCKTGPQPSFCGSNPAGAFAVAKAWLAKPEFQGHRRLVVAWTDLINDPCIAGRAPRHFPDPLKFSWAPLNLEIHIFGLDAQKHDALRKAWAPKPCCHLPFDFVEPKHLGLKAQPL